MKLTTFGILLAIIANSATADNAEILVVDKYTNSPINGAIVLKATLGKNSDTQRYECLFLQSGLTNNEGKSIPSSANTTAISSKYTDIVTSTLAFKHGYRWDMQSTPDNVLRLFQDTLPSEMRLDYLSHMISSSECRTEDNRKDLLLPYFKAIHKEASTLPNSQKSQAILKRIQRRIATAWSPASINNPSKLDRIFENQVKKQLQ